MRSFYIEEQDFARFVDMLAATTCVVGSVAKRSRFVFGGVVPSA